MSSSLPSELAALCQAAVEYHASDLLLHEGRPPLFRINGELQAAESPVLDAAFFSTLWAACGITGEAKDVDTSLTTGEGTRFRVNLLSQLGRPAAVLRRIRHEIPNLSALGLPEALLTEWVGRKSGIILICGPTGSGKSTTIAAMLEWVNQAMVRHIVTIEDPVEFIFAAKRCLFTQREVGIDTESFAEGLRRSLRQNPDIVFLGEIRDAETAMTAIQASETGHLVLATLHSSSCAEAVERMQLFFPTTERDSIRRTLAAQLVGILRQRLLPTQQGGLSVAVEYFTNLAAARKFVDEGRLTDLQDLILKGDDKTAGSFLSSLAALVRDGKLSEETAVASSDNAQELRRLLRGISSSMRAAR